MSSLLLPHLAHVLEHTLLRLVGDRRELYDALGEQLGVVLVEDVLVAHIGKQKAHVVQTLLSRVFIQPRLLEALLRLFD